jgi:Fe-S cluster biogenesis protein NfuA
MIMSSDQNNQRAHQGQSFSPASQSGKGPQNAEAANSSGELLIRVAPTPNPNARKFILSQPVLLEGKANFTSLQEASEVRLAYDLLVIPGVRGVHFFENVITITLAFDQDFDELQPQLIAVIRTRMPIHDPAFNKKHSEKSKVDPSLLPEEVRKIEDILDRTVRPGLQGDGGDLEVLRFENDQLFVRYQGACGSCPSSTTGTLMAIESILRDELGRPIEVIPE